MKFREFVTTHHMSNDELNIYLTKNNLKRMSKGGKHERFPLFGDGKTITHKYDREKHMLFAIKG